MRLSPLVPLLLFAACQPPARVSGQASDFHLDDVNAGSARFGQPVSPRDYVGKVSGWYFGYST